MATIKDSFHQQYDEDKFENSVLKQVEKKRRFNYRPILTVVCTVLVVCFGIRLLGITTFTNYARSSDSSYESTTSSLAMMDYSGSTNNYDYNNEIVEDSVETLNTQKIIYTVSMNLESTDIDQTISDLKQRVSDYGGYITYSNMYTYGDNNEYKSASYTIRIPTASYKEFINESGESANVTSLSEYAEDITDTYIDTSARLENLKLEEETLQGLLEQAETLSDVIAIQQSLTSVRSDIESYESRIKNYDTQVEYTSIDIYITDVARYSSNLSAFDKFINLVQESFDNFVNVLSSIFSFIIYAIPFVLVLGVVYGIYRVIKKKKEKKYHQQ